MASVLIIEDDEPLGRMVHDYLREAGFEVRVCPTQAEGLAMLRTRQFDAVLLDLMLPDGDGLDLCRRWRASVPPTTGTPCDVPVLMLTARGDDTDRIVGLEIGADDYLAKPFNPRELLARLRAILRRRGGGAPAALLRFGRLEIDRAARVARMSGEACTLTAYQFDLLCALADSAGRVLSRDALMNRLRGHDLEAFDRSIDVHVSRIRAQIEDDPKQPRRLITVRGAGYVFAAQQD